MTDDLRIKAGCTVHHIPTSERWRILGVNRKRGEVCVAGWPPTIAQLSDCEYVDEGYELDEAAFASRDKTFGSDWDD